MDRPSVYREVDLDAIEASPDQTSSEHTTKSSSDSDCCWSILKRRMSAQSEDVYTISRRVQETQPRRRIPSIRRTSPSPPSGSPETSRISYIGQNVIMANYRNNQLFREMSLDPYPRDYYRKMPRYCLLLSGFPVTQPHIVTYLWLIDICSEFVGYKALHLSNNHAEHVYAEYTNFVSTRRAALALSGRPINENHILCVDIIQLPPFAREVIVMESQV